MLRNKKYRHRGSKVGGKKLGFESLEWRGLLATLTVSTEADEAIDTDDGILTLREAIAYASLDAFPDPPDQQHIQGTPGQDGVVDEIIIPSGILTTGTITLDSMLGEMNIKRSVTLTGPGRDLLTIDADSDGEGIGNSRIFEINDFQGNAEVQEVTIEGLTLAA